MKFQRPKLVRIEYNRIQFFPLLSRSFLQLVIYKKAQWF